ncbi:hypothetical protein B2J93_4124 [Marssonina coronariae]|uniref:Uncharacterized protein n=1 Tax=Diplocarpon coronariae TaxID=2795749 RepID=A0A218YSP1_9HELO|nr:hypothetical protein B2J93_4124 [Marssonina coronariae]
MADGAGVDGASSLNKPIPNPTSPALGDMEVHPSSNPTIQRQADPAASKPATQLRATATAQSRHPPTGMTWGPLLADPFPPPQSSPPTPCLGGESTSLPSCPEHRSALSRSGWTDVPRLRSLEAGDERTTRREDGGERMQTERSTLHTPPGGDPDVLTQTHHDRPVGTVKPKLQPPERAESIGGTMH